LEIIFWAFILAIYSALLIPPAPIRPR
jgi:hypothetical protein